ncbi:DUF2116 family Zn-ribbon domain-containing protein [Micromonospora sp. WMMA1998]|uniref:DUF2116 family Zn-ribbon domain-containing protein n=1 Tax=Micromonospora sp. WMMA1998 TaxID=3015167 RepID=UPI00248CC241|nr:DUF2116 family Zn-ribbon domain-containing protein [Micromonospora sp. WMMA1998]WBC17580.1 DUF2116 family Zn-ribbon domain-containing protein [Micromonospora sp. WMMA1998]
MSRCVHCGAELPAEAQINRRFCDDRCRSAFRHAQTRRRIAELAAELARLRAAREVTE